MTLPHRIPQPERDDLDNLLSSMSRQLGAITDRAVDDADPTAAAPAVPPPGRFADGRGGGSMWGLHAPRAPDLMTPLQALAQVVERARQLQDMTGQLLTGLTGETVPPGELRGVPLKKRGLLPTILHLAEEVDRVHSEIGRLVTHMRGQL